MGQKIKKGAGRVNDVSNRAVLVMLIFVIIVSLVSMIIYVNLLSNVDTRISTPPSDSVQGVVSLRILPSSGQGENQGEIKTSEADVHE